MIIDEHFEICRCTIRIHSNQIADCLDDSALFASYQRIDFLFSCQPFPRFHDNLYSQKVWRIPSHTSNSRAEKDVAASYAPRRI